MIRKKTSSNDTDVPPTAIEPEPAVEPHTALETRLERQLKVFKAVTGLLFLAVLVLGGTFLYYRHVSRPVEILIDGKSVATVRNYATAVALLAKAEQDAVGDAYPEDSFIRLQKVQFVRTSGDAPLDSEESVRHTLSTLLKLNVRAYVIKVDGKTSIGLPTSQAATQTLAIVKDHYVSMPPNAPIVGMPTFRQHVLIDRMSIPAADTRRTADDAAIYFWTPPPAQTYVVQPGDRGYTIAVRHHIDFTDFLAANSGRDMNKLMPGDVVNLNRVHPALSVIVQKKIVADEPILPDAPPDRAGKRHIVYVVTYTNGEETSRNILSMVTLSRPTPRMSL